jgi:hypothetical protein
LGPDTFSAGLCQKGNGNFDYNARTGESGGLIADPMTRTRAMIAAPAGREA